MQDDRCLALPENRAFANGGHGLSASAPASAEKCTSGAVTANTIGYTTLNVGPGLRISLPPHRRGLLAAKLARCGKAGKCLAHADQLTGGWLDAGRGSSPLCIQENQGAELAEVEAGAEEQRKSEKN